MKITDLSHCPVAEVSEFQEPSATYLVVIAYSYPILVCHQLWDMVDVIDEPFFEIEIHIYDTYHAQ
jgi:hypothetical protein